MSLNFTILVLESGGIFVPYSLENGESFHSFLIVLIEDGSVLNTHT